MDGETKQEKSVRLAQTRVSSAIKRIELVGNLSSANYEFTDEEKEQITKALYGAVDKVVNRFNSPVSPKNGSWQFQPVEQTS